jgi:prophage regulatory protein
MLSVDQVLELIPVSRMTLFRMERKGLFPASHYVSANRRFWYADEILAWQEALPRNPRISKRRGVSGGV